MRESALETWLLIKGSRALAHIPTRLDSPCLWFKYEGCVSHSGDISSKMLGDSGMTSGDQCLSVPLDVEFRILYEESHAHSPFRLELLCAA